MSATAITETLTVVEHMTWVVDHAYIRQQPAVDDDAQILPIDIPRPPQLAVDLIEERIRPDHRGVRREALTVRLFMILLFTAGWHRRIWVRDLHTLATGVLPVDVQRELGILYWSNKHGKLRLHTITAKQLYNMVASMRQHLDVDPAFDLTDEQVADRLAFLDAAQDAFLYATHVLPLTGTALAADESGVWSWLRGGAKPNDLPLVDPSDEDEAAAAKIHRAIEEAIEHLPAPKSDPIEDVDLEDPDATSGTGEADELADEDDPDIVPPRPDPKHCAGEAMSSTTNAGRKRKLGKRCWFAGWGVKTHKTGKRSAYYGYSMHAFIGVPDAGRGGKRAAEAARYREPLLVEEFTVTTPATDVVEPSLALVKKRIARGRPVGDLLGDRHYSYKRFDRWASRLWRLKVRPVLDLRENDHGATYYEGAVIIAGTPHLDPPQHLRRLLRPGKGASKAEHKKFAADIAERQLYAFKRHKTAWSRNDGKPGGDGKTRWVSPVVAGTIGCPHDPDSIQAARDKGQPILNPDGHDQSLCAGGPLWIQPGAHMKLHQEQYWGSPEWLVSWNRRTYVEGAFGLLKNYATGNIHRGYMQFTGQALVTLGLTAAVVAYNLRELENWHARASKHCPDNPLLAIYREHPLHQPTQWVHGFKMLTRAERQKWEQNWRNETACDDDSTLPDAA